MQIDVVRPRQLTDELAARWRALQTLDRAWDSPFLSPDWALAVERAQGGADRGLRVAVLGEGEEAQGFLAVRAGTLTAMAPGGPLCDYQGLVSAPGLRVDTQALVRALGVQRLDFSGMLESQAAFAAHSRGQSASWVVDAPDGYDAYAAERRAAGAGTLKDLDKKRRKAEREAGPIVFTARSASREDFERLFALKSAQFRATAQTDVFAAGWPLQLMRDLFEARGEPFGGALFTLHMGGKLAAVHFHLLGARTVHAWIIAHEDAFERYSPGLLLFQDILRWMDGQPHDRLDLGCGDYRFKRELANVQVPTVHGFVGRPSPASFVRGAAYGVRQAAESLPLGRVSALPGKAMRRLDLLRGLR